MNFARVVVGKNTRSVMDNEIFAGETLEVVVYGGNRGAGSKIRNLFAKFDFCGILRIR